ncbi:hypothetical protein, partial [Megamonas funiformis]
MQVPQAVQDMKDNYKKSVKDVKVSGMIEEINTRNGVYRACVYYPTGMDLTYSPCLKAGDSWIQTIL